MDATVEAVSRSATHTMTKPNVSSIMLLTGLGVDGDAHMGATVKHRSRVRRDPTQPNLRQVHLIASELHEQLQREGFSIAPGAMGENITTRGIDLHALPAGTRLALGPGAVIALTGLRNPCGQLNGTAAGLLDAVRDVDATGIVVRRRAGVMAVVVRGGEVRPGMRITVVLPEPPHAPLAPV